MTLSSVWVGLLPSAWIGPLRSHTHCGCRTDGDPPYWLHSMDCFCVATPPWILATTYWRVHSTPVAACTVCRIVIQGLASVWPWRKYGLRQQVFSSPDARGYLTHHPGSTTPHFKPLTWRHQRECERVCVWAFVCVALYSFTPVKGAQVTVRLSFGLMCLCGWPSCSVLVNLCFCHGLVDWEQNGDQMILRELEKLYFYCRILVTANNNHSTS